MSRIICAECETVIGHVELTPEGERLRVGALLLERVGGACAVCQRAFHWSPGRRAIRPGAVDAKKKRPYTK